MSARVGPMGGHIHKWVRRFVMLKLDDGRRSNIAYKVCTICRKILM